MDIQQRKLVRRELLKIQMQEQKLEAAAKQAKPSDWKGALEKKIPEKVYSGLQTTFCTGFSLVFKQGRKLIEITYRKARLQSDHQLRDWEIQRNGRSRAWRQMHKSAKKGNGLNMMATAAEGMALGALGVGLPDIVLFLSTLLKGIYETALHYGFEYETPGEQYLILRMMSASLKSGKAWIRENARVDALLQETALAVSPEVLKEQIQETASVFAMDMLVLKFIQGMPIVGILGGAANPVYYRKVLRYVQLKYKKRYLLKQSRIN